MHPNYCSFLKRRHTKQNDRTKVTIVCQQSNNNDYLLSRMGVFMVYGQVEKETPSDEHNTESPSRP
jgi:hypothetical protein